ncbi:MAG: hypothetical protein ABFS19_11625 [Thermodesulfobacteriota bacterium]
MADDSALPKGEYRLLGYSLENSGSASFYTLQILPEALDTVHNRGADLHGEARQNNLENLSGFAIKAAYAPTTNITLHSSLGLTDKEELEQIDYTDRVGWEIDLGVAYRLLNNLTYEIHFGYMDTGEVFKQSNSFTDIEDVTIFTNKLTMSF